MQVKPELQTQACRMERHFHDTGWWAWQTYSERCACSCSLYFAHTYVRMQYGENAGQLRRQKTITAMRAYILRGVKTGAECGESYALISLVPREITRKKATEEQKKKADNRLGVSVLPL